LHLWQVLIDFYGRPAAYKGRLASFCGKQLLALLTCRILVLDLKVCTTKAIERYQAENVL